jgi:hypothetical protein
MAMAIAATETVTLTLDGRCAAFGSSTMGMA